MTSGEGDRVEAVRRREPAKLLDGIDETMIASLPVDVLLDLRRRILAADFAPSTAASAA